MPTLVYIGGYGHSGSTLLECLMAASPKVVACGEVSSVLAKRYKKKRLCTCGRAAQDCSIWGRFSLPSRSDGRSSWTHRSLSLALFEQVSEAYSVMTDSSKTAWSSAKAPFALRRELGMNFQLVHVVRNPRGVCWSIIRKAERGSPPFSERILKCFISTAGWWIANLACEIFGWLYPDQYTLIRYEDLARSPHAALGHLFAKLSLDSGSELAEITAGGNRHQLFGNRMRHRPLSLSCVQEDTRWKVEMPAFYRLFVAFFSWPLRSKYKY
jgi:hypothetical protein